MPVQTYSVGGSSKIILGRTEDLDPNKLVYSGYHNDVALKQWTFDDVAAQPVRDRVAEFTGNEDGIIGPMPPGYVIPVVVKRVAGQWAMMLTACHTRADRIYIQILWWSNVHPDKWYGNGGISEQTKSEWESFPAYGRLAFQPDDYSPGYPILQYGRRFSYLESYNGRPKLKNTFPNAISTNDNPVPPVFPGTDNTDDSPGGDGEGPDGIEDDPIEIPGDPSLSAANAGLLTLYTPTLSQIHNFGSYLWSDSFSLDTFKKLFSDPMEAVIGLSVVPVSVPSAGAQNIIIGVMDSGVSANRVASQYVTVDCGTISVKPIWNTALDFEPYTKFSVFLPFIGTREISTDDIMGKDVNIKYLVDVLSGACTAHIKVGGSVLYQFSGSCTTPIPISALNWSNLVTSSIGLLAGGTAAAATGGVAGGVALAAMTAGAVARSKPTIQRAGNVSGAAGMLGVKIPYLIRESPRQSLAKDYNKFVGYPSNITSKLSDLKGYTQVENIHLEGIPATGDELSEIESLLKEGVIL